jgi:hypothetical protein
LPKITQLEIHSYRGIKIVKISIAPAGALIRGRNASGKTSILQAIRAALAAQDVGPDAIHLGDDQAEIIVNLDALRVRRSITAAGSSLAVTTPEGDRWARPQTRLNELLGTCALDPLSFFLAKADERRRQVLEAIPIEVTAEDLERWNVDPVLADLARHGLEVLERLRKTYYDRRAEANRRARDGRIAADAAQVRATEVAAALNWELPAEPEASLAVQVAEQAAHQAESRRAGAEQARLATQGIRDRAAQLRARSADIRSQIPAPVDTGPAMQAWRDAAAAAEALEVQLNAAREKEAETRASYHRLQIANDAGNTKEADAAASDAQAMALEDSLADVEAKAVSVEEVAAAREALGAALITRERVASQMQARRAKDAASDADDKAVTAELAARQLGAIVETLTSVAPRELSARSSMIPGLAISPDGGIALDGVEVDHLSGAEQMRFAVDLARRANAKARILVVDGLERLDPERFTEFVTYATRDDWQLIGTRVDKGEMVIEAIEADDAQLPLLAGAE